MTGFEVLLSAGAKSSPDHRRGSLDRAGVHLAHSSAAWEGSKQGVGIRPGPASAAHLVRPPMVRQSTAPARVSLPLWAKPLAPSCPSPLSSPSPNRLPKTPSSRCHHLGQPFTYPCRDQFPTCEISWSTSEPQPVALSKSVLALPKPQGRS